MPAARPTSAKLMQKMAAALITFRNGSVPRNSLETIGSASASTRIGTSPVQNLDHRNAFMVTGAVRTSQNAAPSAETAGNTKRTATDESTNEAIARFTNA